MLKLGGYINILIALAHLVGLLWANKMFEITGVGKPMYELAQIHPSLPYLLTVAAAVAFTIMGLYGLSADNKLRKLPFLKPIIFIIAGIYLLRGIAGIIFAIIKQNSLLEISYALIAILIGFLFLFGGLKKWK